MTAKHPTPTAAQRRRLVDLLRQVQVRRLTLRPARRLSLCYRSASAPDDLADAAA